MTDIERLAVVRHASVHCSIAADAGEKTADNHSTVQSNLAERTHTTLLVNGSVPCKMVGCRKAQSDRYFFGGEFGLSILSDETGASSGANVTRELASNFW